MARFRWALATHRAQCHHTKPIPVPTPWDAASVGYGPLGQLAGPEGIGQVKAATSVAPPAQAASVPSDKGPPSIFHLQHLTKLPALLWLLRQWETLGLRGVWGLQDLLMPGELVVSCSCRSERL